LHSIYPTILCFTMLIWCQFYLWFYYKILKCYFTATFYSTSLELALFNFFKLKLSKFYSFVELPWSCLLFLFVPLLSCKIFVYFFLGLKSYTKQWVRLYVTQKDSSDSHLFLIQIPSGCLFIWTSFSWSLK
jgi:hypothetical protein